MIRICLAILLAAVPLWSQSFADVTTTTGLTQPPRPSLFLGLGWCTGDFDGDGDLDIISVASPGAAYSYFRNDGAMTWSDQSASAGLGVAPLVRQLTCADVDNDGDQDVYVCNNAVPNQLFINDGTGTFTEEAAARGVDYLGNTWAAAFGDYDRDGQLDLYLGIRNDPALLYTPNLLYRNTGDGYFNDVTISTGAGEMGLTLVVVWFDYNEDGWPDIFCANDKGTSQPPNAVYRNNTDGTFTEVSASINAMQGICGMGLDFLDAFNDGGQDVYCTDSGTDHLFLVWDPTTQTYVQMQNQLGVGVVTSIGWACHFLDYDNDCWPDLHVVHGLGANLMFRNPGASVGSVTPWIDVTGTTGVGTFHQQYSAVVADFDQDGRLDILNALQGTTATTPAFGFQMLKNGAGAGNWLNIDTEGVLSNRDGLGARVRVTAGGLTQEQQVRSGIGYVTGSPHNLHFGLGPSTIVDRIEITWPSGIVQTLHAVNANQAILIKEPSLQPSAQPAVGTTLSLDLAIAGDGGLGYIMGLALADQPGIGLPSGRTIPISYDSVLQWTSTPGNNVLLQPAGTLSGAGAASSPLVVPNLPALNGLSVFCAAVSLDAGSPDGVKTIVPGPRLTIQ